MEIVGVEVNDVILPYVREDNSSGHFRAFMYYCIDNYFDQILIIDSLKHEFSLIPDDPVFKRAVFYKKIEGYKGLYYSMYSGNEKKTSLIKKIARKLDIEVYVHTFE